MKIEYGVLHTYCNTVAENFEGLGQIQIGPDGRKNIFIDNGSNVLAVAHLDFVNDAHHFHVIDIKGTDYVVSTRLDDRLGVFMLLELLPLFGVMPDILLTTDEEIGKSTGGNFIPLKQYNWMFQFDRRNDGCVTYMYKEQPWLDALKKNFKIDHGSASDISHMEHLKCSAVNVGTGYYDEHDDFCMANMDVMVKQVTDFAAFYAENEFIYYPHDKAIVVPYTRTYTYPTPPQPVIGDDGYTDTAGHFHPWEELDDVEDEIFRMLDDYPDGWEYRTFPKNCKFCGRSLEGDDQSDRHFAGICTHCYDYTYNCEACDETVFFPPELLEVMSIHDDWLCPTCQGLTMKGGHANDTTEEDGDGGSP